MARSLLERFRRLDENEGAPPDLLAVPAEVPEATREKVSAILAVVVRYLPDPGENPMASTLFAIARKELLSATEAQLDVVIIGLVAAADALRAYLPELGPAEAAGA